MLIARPSVRIRHGRLYLPGAVRPGPSCVRAPASQSKETRWSVRLLKAERGAHFPALEALQPQILPPEGVEAIVKAQREKEAAADDARSAAGAGASMDVDGNGNGLEGSAAPAGAASGNDAEMRGLASEMLKRALGNENAARSRKGAPELMLSNDDEEDDVEEGQTAQNDSKQQQQHCAASSSTQARSLSGPRCGYGFAGQYDAPLDQGKVDISRSYLLKAADPVSIDASSRSGKAREDEDGSFDVERYM